MATLNGLVQAVSAVTGLPEATVFAYGRFAREAGLIQQAGRGHSAAAMTIRDAANILLAIGGTGVTREAAETIETFRALRNGLFYRFVGIEFLTSGLDWLLNFGVRPGEPGGPLKIPKDFGSFFEFLISSTLDGQLARLFRKIPVAEIPSDTYGHWQRERSPHLNETLDVLVDKGLVKPCHLADYEFGEHINVEITFSRTVPSVDISFLRLWDSPQTIGAITFGPERGGKANGAHRLQINAQFTQHTLAAVGMVVSNKVRPNSIRNLKGVEGLFWNQFQALAGLPGTT